MEHNSELQIQLRKHQNRLAVIGLGVIAFGVWSVLKTVLYSTYNSEVMIDPSTGAQTSPVIFWVTMAVAMVIELTLRLRVGLSAIAEGHGRRKRSGYIVLALLMAFASLAAIVLMLRFFGSSNSVIRGVVTIIVEATSCIMLVEMAISAIQVKRLEKKLEGQVL